MINPIEVISNKERLQFPGGDIQIVPPVIIIASTKLIRGNIKSLTQY